MSSSQVIATKVIAAHRGGKGLMPENSLAAFENAVRLGVDMAEFDIHLTRDREIVVIHDATLDRTTNGEGPVSDRTLSELKKLSLKDMKDAHIPALDEVIQVIAPSPLVLRVEIKVSRDNMPYPAFERRLSERLMAAGLLSRSVITSFHWDCLQAFQACATPQNMIGLMRPQRFRELGGLDGALRALAQAGLCEIAIRIECLESDFPARARAAGLRLGAYGVNSDEEIRKALDADVTALTTDFPDRALALRAELNACKQDTTAAAP